MRILSLFDGISIAQQALNNLGVKNYTYFASEIEPYPIAITQRNFPQTQQLGDVKSVTKQTVGNIDLLIGGSPCQDLSVAKKNREGLDGQRSGLFWEFVRILREINPKYFILENVASMSYKSRDNISAALGVKPIMINASLFSAQDRKRYFWTNIENLYLPEDRGIVLKNIIDMQADRKWIDISDCQRVRKTKTGIAWDKSGKGYHSPQDRAYSILGKHPTVPTCRTITKVKVLFEDGRIGNLNWNEIERLQSLPDGYTDMGSNNRIETRGGAIGNGFNCAVIEHILKNII